MNFIRLFAVVSTTKFYKLLLHLVLLTPTMRLKNCIRGKIEIFDRFFEGLLI